MTVLFLRAVRFQALDGRGPYRISGLGRRQYRIEAASPPPSGPPGPSPGFDWSVACAGDPARKRAFHGQAIMRLNHLAFGHLGFSPGDFDLRSNLAGDAVSGEVTLHHERVYVQVSQPSGGGDRGLLIRKCAGRGDFIGGPNHMADLAALDDLPRLAGIVRRAMNQP